LLVKFKLSWEIEDSYIGEEGEEKETADRSRKAEEMNDCLS